MRGFPAPPPGGTADANGAVHSTREHLAEGVETSGRFATATIWRFCRHILVINGGTLARGVRVPAVGGSREYDVSGIRVIPLASALPRLESLIA